MSKPVVGVVTVGFESADVWPDFFASLSRSTLKPQSVVVIDNSPEAPEGLTKLYKGKLTLRHRPDNPGYGAAINEGVSLLPSDCTVIVMCNPDIIFEPDALQRLADALTATPHAGIAGPAVVNPDGSIYPSARAFPGIRVGIGHAILGEIWKKNPWTQRYLGVYEGDDVRIVDWLSGSCLVAKREALLGKVGGFDPGYFMFLEDVDLCFRLKRAGWRSLYVPGARIEHSGGHSTRSRMADMVKVHHESARRFLFRLYDKPAYWPLRQVLRVGLALRSILARIKYRNER
jgi:N-acetylglucosaminyl-diphospho-decaprenol L-rhamnosyltransferase